MIHDVVVDAEYVLGIDDAVAIYIGPLSVSPEGEGAILDVFIDAENILSVDYTIAIHIFADGRLTQGGEAYPSEAIGCSEVVLVVACRGVDIADDACAIDERFTCLIGDGDVDGATKDGRSWIFEGLQSTEYQWVVERKGIGILGDGTIEVDLLEYNSAW